MRYGFLLDVDGTSTENRGPGVETGLDKKLLERIRTENEKGHRFAFLTGRAGWYVEDEMEAPMKEFDVYSCVPIIAEFGFYNVIAGKAPWDYYKHEPMSWRGEMKQAIIEYARKRGIRIIGEERKQNPETGEIWFEPGIVKLSTRTNPHGGIDGNVVYDTVTSGLRGIDTTDFIITKTDLDTVIHPQDLNKENMARTAMQILDPSGKILRWYSFGDSSNDAHMRDAAPDRITYIDVRGYAADGVLHHLDRILGKR